MNFASHGFVTQETVTDYCAFPASGINASHPVRKWVYWHYIYTARAVFVLTLPHDDAVIQKGDMVSFLYGLYRNNPYPYVIEQTLVIERGGGQSTVDRTKALNLPSSIPIPSLRDRTASRRSFRTDG